MQLEIFSEKIIDELNDLLLKPFANSNDLSTVLHESMTYSITNGGKRLRPLIALASLQALGVDYQLGLASAQAVEYIHTYSLVHDDLPAMDDDDYRRGKLSNHKKFDEATAILAGDGLLTYAFEVITTDERIVSPAIKLQLTQLLAQAAGHQGMVAGQIGDMQAEGNEISLQQLKKIHDAKTGALIKFAVNAATIIAETDTDISKQLNIFAGHYGIAYQIQNDLQDIVWTDEERGKKATSDTDHDKNTYPALLGNEGAMAALADEIATCKQAISHIKAQRVDFDDELLLGFLTYLKL